MTFFFFFNDTATTEIYTLSLHDALPISHAGGAERLQIGRPHVRRGERELLEETERDPDLGIDRRGAPISQHRFDQLVVLEGQRRDRAVSTRSESTLVQPRRERGEQLPLTHGPGRRAAHHRLSPVAHRAVMRGPSPWTVGERELFAALDRKSTRLNSSHS